MMEMPSPPVVRYLEKLMGFPLKNDESKTSTSETVSKGYFPFLQGCKLMELRIGQHIVRAVAPGQENIMSDVPLAKIPGNRTEYSFLFAENPLPEWQKPNAVRIEDDAPVEGEIRMPSRACAFGIKAGEKFVSWASAADFGDVMYVTVETSPTHRGRGFATQSLRALTRHLLDNKQTPVYLCEARSLSSRRTALAAGYQEFGTLYRIQ